jgi:demethylmenaquinone methyltransferase / 2-methoxy-6-polyprenyl-1,4-benzoquinol methylase
MPNRYYTPGADRARHVEILFNQVAPRYDRLNDLQSLGMHRLWKREVIRQAVAFPGCRVLDVCCGTGDLALGMARLGARVVGLDFSAPMLHVAQRRSQATLPDGSHSDFHQLTWVRGDALRLPFVAGIFDVVTIGYGLRNLGSFEDGLKECRRVTRPGGRLLILDFGKPSNRLLRVGYFSYLRLVVPWFGRLACGDADAYAYILESLHHYPDREGLHRLLNEAGWESVRTRGWLGGVMTLTSATRMAS